MTPAQTNAWLRLGLDSWTLGLASTRVVGLRAARLAEGGPGAGFEAWLMCAEKWQAAMELGAELGADALGRGGPATPLASSRRALAHYRRKVAANARRLR